MPHNPTATMCRFWISTLVGWHSGIWGQRSGVLSTYFIQESVTVDAEGIQGPRCRLSPFSPLETLAFHLPSLLFPKVYKPTLEFIVFHFRSSLSLAFAFELFPPLLAARCSSSAAGMFLRFCLRFFSFGLILLGFWVLPFRSLGFRASNPG